MDLAQELDKSLQQASILLEKTKQRSRNSTKADLFDQNIQREHLQSIQALSSQLATVNSNLLTETSELMEKQTKTLTRIGVGQVDHLFQVQHRWLRNQVRQIRELKAEISDLQVESLPTDKSSSRLLEQENKENMVFISQVQKVEQKVDHLSREIHHLTLRLKDEVLNVAKPKEPSLDYASITSALRSLRSQARLAAMRPTWKDSFTSTNVKEKSKTSPIKRSLPPLPNSNAKKEQLRSDLKIPKFYNNVPLGEPILLGKSGIRRPASTNPPILGGQQVHSKRVRHFDTDAKMTVHSRPTTVAHKALPLDFGRHVVRNDRCTSTTGLSLPSTPIPSSNVMLREDKAVSPSINLDPRIIEPSIKFTSLESVESRPIQTRDEYVQHTVRNVSIQHGHEYSLSISDSESIVLTAESKPHVEREKEPVASVSREPKYTGKTMERRLAEWIQEEVLLRLVKPAPIEIDGPATYAHESLPLEKITSAEIEKNEPKSNSFMQTDLSFQMEDNGTQTVIPIRSTYTSPIPEVIVKKEIISVQIQTVQEEEYEEPSHIVELSDFSSVSISDSKSSLAKSTSSSPSPNFASPRIVTDQQVVEVYQDLVEEAIKSEVLQSVYETVIQISFSKPVTPLPTVDIVTKVAPDPHIAIKPEDTVHPAEEEQWDHKRTLSAEESLLMDVQKIKQETLEQLQVERKRLILMDIEKQAIEKELDLLRKKQFKTVVDVSVQKEEHVVELPKAPIDRTPPSDTSANRTDKAPGGEKSSFIERSSDSLDDTPSYSSVVDPTQTTEKKSDESSMSLTVSSLPTYSSGELLFRFMCLTSAWVK
jgi:hypothetical protein